MAAQRLFQQVFSMRTLPLRHEKKKGDGFAKIGSYSEVKEARIDLKEKHETIIQRLRQKPDPSIRCPETVCSECPLKGSRDADLACYHLDDLSVAD
jgi:hypothetical protein